VEADRLNIALGRVPDINPGSESEIDIKICCFEKFKVFIRGEEIKFRTAKAEEMLALLIGYDGREIHRNTIMDLFWTDYDGDRAIILFNTTLHYLKKAFLMYGMKLNIKYNRGAYSLQLPGIFCDVHYFETRLEELMPVSKDNIRECEELAELYKGNYLEQNGYTWSEQKRMKLKERYLKLILETAKYYQTAGQGQKSVECLQRGLYFDPLSKSLNYRLLKALRNNRDKVAMLNYYEIYRAGLSAEFGIEPDEEIKNLIG